MSLNVLSLFAGIGGLELGLERAGMTVVGQVEIDDYCRRVLAKHWPNVPRHDDVRTAAEWWLSTERPTVDVICGGFPCQDISAAGRRAGIIDGGRSSLWSFMADTVRRVRPRYVLVENVPRVLVRGRDGYIPAEIVAADLAEIGYDLRWDCIPAAALGAPHLRDRWFGVAYAHGCELRNESVGKPRGSDAAITPNYGSARVVADAAGDTEPDEPEGGNGALVTLGTFSDGRSGASGGPDARVGGGAGPTAAIVASHVADSDRPRLTDVQGWPSIAERAGLGTIDRAGWWRTEPAVGRVVDGVPTRLDRDRQRERVKALGNAVVPQVAEYVGRLIVAHAEQVAA